PGSRPTRASRTRPRRLPWSRRPSRISATRCNLPRTGLQLCGEESSGPSTCAFPATTPGGAEQPLQPGQERALADGDLHRSADVTDPFDVEAPLLLGEDAAHVVEVLAASGEHLHRHEVLGADHWHHDAAEVERAGALDELLIEPRRGDDQIERHP